MHLWPKRRILHRLCPFWSSCLSSPSSFVWALRSGGGRVLDVLTHRCSSLAAELSLLLGGVGHVSHVEMAEVDLEKI